MNRRQSNILLVEPPYRSVYLPLGLQKIAAYHLQRGDKVKFIHEHPKKFFAMSKPETFNRIYITSIFTYYGKTVVSIANYLKRLFPNSRIAIGGVFASLMPDYIKEKTGITPHVGLYDKVENVTPDYSIFPRTNQALIFTSRGCVHNCEFCAVSTIVPNFYITAFKKQIEAGYNAGFRHFNIQDNNFAATPYSHQKAVVDYLATYEDITVDFNSGIDVRVFSEKKAKLLTKLTIPSIRFAFDAMNEDGYYQKAVAIAHKYKIYKKEVISYVLYNFNESLEELWYRMNEVLKAGSSIYAMKFAPLDALNKSYIGKHWTRRKINNFKTMLQAYSSVGQLVNPRGIDGYKNRKIGRTAEEFIEMISGHMVENNYFSALRRSPRARSISFGLTDRAEMEESIKRNVKRGVLHKDGTRKVKGKLTPGREMGYYQSSGSKKGRHLKRKLKRRGKKK
jgi:hypothetical protein